MRGNGWAWQLKSVWLVLLARKEPQLSRSSLSGFVAGWKTSERLLLISRRSMLALWGERLRRCITVGGFWERWQLHRWFSARLSRLVRDGYFGSRSGFRSPTLITPWPSRFSQTPAAKRNGWTGRDISCRCSKPPDAPA